MSSFKGKHLYTMDSKGRINLPAKIRHSINSEANESVVITRGYEQCLFVYPLDEWKIFEARLRALSPTQAVNRHFTRQWMENAADAQFDKQGRISLPPHLIQYARLEREILIIGNLERIEVWNPHEHEATEARITEPLDQLAEKIMI